MIHIIEQSVDIGLVRSVEDNGSFEVRLPKDACILSSYCRNGKFYFLYQTENSTDRVIRTFFVVHSREDESRVLVSFSNPIRYIGGDHIQSALLTDASTVHFFEMLSPKTASNEHNVMI
jgi:hypothetical protein